MYTKVDKEKLDKIYRMILEVANGNLSYKIIRSRDSGPIEKIIVALNMMVEEIREKFHHFAHINPHETYYQQAQTTFILDNDFRILNFNRGVQKLLELPPEEIKDREFKSFLTLESQEIWEKEILFIKSNEYTPYNKNLHLSFYCSNSLTFFAVCAVSSLLLKKEKQQLYLITAAHTVVESRERETKIKIKLEDFKQERRRRNKSLKSLLYRESDIMKIQEIHDYILLNLTSPLPSLRTLAHDHGTNEFKLKTGFKQLYNTSVFRFQKEQRLKRAHNILATSDISLSQVSELCGFKSLPHFSKIFKKRYGYNPSELKYRSRS